jgi:arsenate reductase
MAEGLMNNRMGDGFKAYSAGTHPRPVNAHAIATMKELDIDISEHRSKNLDEFDGCVFDIVVTVCSNADDTCPFIPGKEHIHKGFGDPSIKSGSEEDIIEEFRQVRDDIWNWMKDKF